MNWFWSTVFLPKHPQKIMSIVTSATAFYRFISWENFGAAYSGSICYLYSAWSHQMAYEWHANVSSNFAWYHKAFFAFRVSVNAVCIKLLPCHFCHVIERKNVRRRSMKRKSTRDTCWVGGWVKQTHAPRRSDHFNLHRYITYKYVTYINLRFVLNVSYGKLIKCEQR